MKVITSNIFSKKEVNAFKDFYMFLLEPFRFGKGDEFKADIFRPELLKRAIDMLEEKEQASVYAKIYYEAKSSNSYNKGVRKLRSLRYRAIYDYSLIKKVERAEDYSSYEPCVVLGYVRMYDDFRLQNSSYTFNIELLSEIVTLVRDKKILELSYGLADGTSYKIKDVADMLNISVSECKKLKDDALHTLQKLYC